MPQANAKGRWLRCCPTILRTLTAPLGRSRWQAALVTSFACTNLRWVFRHCLSKLAYMSHVVLGLLNEPVTGTPAGMVATASPGRHVQACDRHVACPRRPTRGSGLAGSRSAARRDPWAGATCGCRTPSWGAGTARQHADDTRGKPASGPEMTALQAERALRSASIVLVRDPSVPASAEPIGS